VTIRAWPPRRLALAGAAAALALFAAPAGAAEFPLHAGDSAVGEVQYILAESGDNLADIARQADIGYTEMLAANRGVDPWSPALRTLAIPGFFILPDAPREGIVINLAERRLYYFPRNGETVQTYPIGIGVIGRDTPLSVTRVVGKEEAPTWYPPPSIRAERPELPPAVGPGPDNPLGDFALRLGWPRYLIHGTNKPDGVGRNVSHGCLHLYPEDIASLYEAVPIGTPVRAIEQPAAAAWVGTRLLLEVHPDKEQADQIDMEQPMTPRLPAGLRELVADAAGEYADAIDWAAVERAGLQRSGLPVEIARRPLAELDAAR